MEEGDRFVGKQTLMYFLWIALDLLCVPFVFVVVVFFRSYRYVCTPCTQSCITHRFMNDASDSDYSKE